MNTITKLHNKPPVTVDESDIVAELRVKDLAALLDQAHKELLVSLLAKLTAGTANHQELAILRNLLRDNGMVLSVRPTDPDHAPQSPTDLPAFDDPEYEN